MLDDLYLPELIEEAKSAMKKDSFFLIPNAYSEEFCEKIKADMDKIQPGIGVEYNCCDMEIGAWFGKKKNSRN
jgi:hypothetical protein